MLTTPVIVFLILLIAKTAMERRLSSLNRKEVLANKDAVPAVYRDVVDDETYRKSVDYTLAKNALGKIDTFYEAIVLALIVCTGFLAWLYNSLTAVLGEGVWGQSVVLFLVLIIIGLPSIPMDWWSTFKLEAKFGFNKSTIGLWITDKIKGFVLGAILGIPVLALLLSIFNWLPVSWWFWGFFTFFILQLLLMVLYPRLIMPLFNKLSPLEDGPLRDRLLALGERTGFSAQTILVMDGSKRSSHSNAFFTGFGKFRKIVLYDTLIEQLEPIELESVLAHEIGHYKKGHIPKTLLIGFFTGLGGFAVMGWLATQDWFYTNFGFDPHSGMAPVLLLFMLISGLFTFWLSPLSNRMSRKHEYEADAFARKTMQDDPMPLIKSLHKMYEKNLSNFTPHPKFSNFYYSHPTLLEREAALRQEPAES
ncbi:M48 family metallopeptidase [Cerasicoccus arenae]|uniref:Peptidase n=1 Tax=Cerasicoccus arenae TaxID=424488 RepID=A0A8J3DII0_9BACT|nr:M48 family metallopeptidase [Cerasicoccus arenae]MBK1859059.1 M48 family metallopeptidase [Cerasicoccus arenae]GHC03402.1 peptidase [Cerasicoccus arenae]